VRAGAGAARAAQIVAAVELGGARSSARRSNVRSTTRRSSLPSYLLPQYGAALVEQFGIVMLDTKHRVIRSEGGRGRSLDSRSFTRARSSGSHGVSAAAIVLFHNHPSGDPTPSSDDLR
jgi:DNA repair protein RadC